MCEQGDEEEVARGRQARVEEGSWGEGGLHAIEAAREQRRLQEERSSRHTQESWRSGLADVQRRWLAEEGSREVCYPLILHLVDFSVSRQSIEQVHLFKTEFKSLVCSRVSQFLASLFIFCKHMCISPWRYCKKCLSI